MIRLHILASGSGGNAAIVETGTTGEGVLIDCGICKRDFFARAEEAGFDLAGLRAVVVTHDHGDHTKGMGVVLRGLAKAGVVPTVRTSAAIFAASAPLRDAVASVDAPFAPFAAGDVLELAGLVVRPFRTSHDAAESYGFRFDELEGGESDSLGYVTDTGIMTEEARDALAGVRLLALESNHDVRMLEAGPYPYVIKQRIASERGHLSNAQAAEVLGRLAHNDLRHVAAMHVSQENNTYRLPRETFEAVIAEQGLATTVSVAFQNRLVTIE
ncbi:MBL fold metallo-hydrolase [Adlercreutzia shanghongiae]|uniref:MBL fold metallo-hydrolase n=1 Tax=Adlercreutzia shanghongiae TaxID=3111773 RepID=A0ABU6IYF1_9ACTN|nr:MBL fold metallo-hydrolase [Adlercreutzia sp. R22]MEC4294885.1 MBL fold metallo-hydrolase [Adlercreutzia sp. R22]